MNGRAPRRQALLAAVGLALAGAVAQGSAASVPQSTANAVSIPDNYAGRATKYLDFSYDPQHEAAIEPLAEEGDEIWERITAEIDLPAPVRPRIVVTRGPEEFAAVQRSPVSHWAAGIAYPADGVLVLRIVGIGPEPSRNLLETMAHELSHLALYRATGRYDLPRWFAEGLAIYHSRQWTWDRFTTIARAAALGGLLSFESLTKRWPRSETAAHLAYAQSAWFVGYLNSQYGAEGIRTLIRLLGQGRDFDAACREAFGKGLKGLEKSFRETLRWYYVIIPLVTGSSFLWFVLALLLVFGYLRRRRENARRLAAMELAEHGFGAPSSISGLRVPPWPAKPNGGAEDQ